MGDDPNKAKTARGRSEHGGFGHVDHSQDSIGVDVFDGSNEVAQRGVVDARTMAVRDSAFLLSRLGTRDIPDGGVTTAHGDLDFDDLAGQGDLARIDAPLPQLLVGCGGAHANITFSIGELRAFDIAVVDKDDGVEVFGLGLEKVGGQ